MTTTRICTRPSCGRPADGPRGLCHADYESFRKRQILYGRWEDMNKYVPAGPALEHATALRAAGLGKRRIADLAGVHLSHIYSLVTGRSRSGHGSGPATKITRRVADAILAIPVPAVPAAVAADGALVDATGTRRRIQALVAAGHPMQDIAEGIAWSPSNLSRLLQVDTVTAKTARTVTALYERLQLIPGPSDRARHRAARAGWPPPLAWDEDEIDDPTAQPADAAPASEVDEALLLRLRALRTVTRRPVEGRPIYVVDRAARSVHVPAQDRHLYFDELGRLGWTQNEIQRAMGLSTPAFRAAVDRGLELDAPEAVAS